MKPSLKYVTLWFEERIIFKIRTVTIDWHSIKDHTSRGQNPPIYENNALCNFKKCYKYSSSETVPSIKETYVMINHWIRNWYDFKLGILISNPNGMPFDSVVVFKSSWGVLIFFFWFEYFWSYCGLKALLSGLLPVLPRSLLVKPHISETAIGSSSTIYLSPSAIYQISIHTSMGAWWYL